MDFYKDLITYLKEKFSTPGVQKHSINMGWMFFARIASLAVTFLATAIIARHLGPSNYGELSYAISFVSLFSCIATFGIDQILHRELVKSPEKKNLLLGSALFARALTSLLSIVVVLASATIFSTEDVSMFLIFIISLAPLFGTFQLLGYEFQADSKAKYTSILSIVVVTILNLIKIGIIFAHKGVIYLAAVVLLEPILYSIGYLYLKQRYYKDLRRLSIALTSVHTLLRDSFPLLFASVFYALYARIDQVMLKHMINAEAVGLYDAAVRVSELSYMVPSIILLALFPVIIKTREHDEKLYYARMKRLMKFLVLITTLIALVATILAKPIILTIYGSTFLGAVPVLQIYMWSNVSAALNLFGQQILLTENMTYRISIMMFFGMIANVVLNLYLIPLYGAHGAAFATLVSYAVPFFSLFFFGKTSAIMRSIAKS